MVKAFDCSPIAITVFDNLAVFEASPGHSVGGTMLDDVIVRSHSSAFVKQ